MFLKYRGALAFLTLIWLFADSGEMLFAQGGGGSTGTITGRVVDPSGGVLPGVTVTATSASLMGVQTSVSDPSGSYRFPAVPAGDYTLRFELPGFTTLVREGVRVALGFTAAVDVTMKVEQLAETVVVSGESPVIDASATRAQTSFSRDVLEALPNSRDIYSLLSTTASVVARADVGGNTAGQQTPYWAYGYRGQVRQMIEGINYTDASASGIMIYLDYGSFDQAFISPAGNSAEMPTSGVMMQFIAKSGGDRFSGGGIFDYQTERFQATNLTDEQVQPVPGGPLAFRGNNANRLYRYTNVNLDVGGPVLKQKLWFYTSFVRQENQSRQPPVGTIADGTIFPNRLTNGTGKGTFSATARDTFIGYYQYGIKAQPYRSDGSTLGNPIHVTYESTRNQSSPQYVFKGEYQRTFGQNGFAELRYGGAGFDILFTNHVNAPRYEDIGNNQIRGGGEEFVAKPDRRQFTAAYSWFVDQFVGGNHNIKTGVEVADETNLLGFRRGFPGDVIHILQNGAPTQVRLQEPAVSRGNERTYSAFITDTVSLNRVTATVGVRFDRYRSYLREQEKPASTFVPTPIVFPAVKDVGTFDTVAPRLGLTIDVTGDRKSIVKVNFGRFGFNPGTTLADAANPNTSQQYSQFNWNDLNRDLLFQPGEEGTLIARVGGAAATGLDPDLESPYSNELSTWLEHELAGDMAARVGYVWKKSYRGYQRVNELRPFSAYNVPVQVPDPGAPGQVIDAFNLDDLSRGFRSIVRNIDGYEGTYKTLEMGIQKRYSGRWSLGAFFSRVWTHEFGSTYQGNAIGTAVANASFLNGNYPDNPNDRTENDFAQNLLKIYGLVSPAWGIRITPVIKSESGAPYGRVVLARLNYNSAQRILVEPLGTRQQDAVTTVDLRIEKEFRTFRSSRLGLYLDVYNLLNANPVLTLNWVTGPTFEYPQSVLPPRVLRLGGKFAF